jgi:lipoprotein-anchoring transpeptidase ErfK/SrfK
MSRALFLTAVSMAAMLAACNQSPPPAAKPQGAPPVQPVTELAPASSATPAPNPTLDAASVNTAAYAPNTVDSPDRSPTLVRAQVLLDRAKFSPGVIDGKPGENVRQAIEAYQQANGLPADGKLTQAVFDKLAQADTGPALKSYTITADDVKGPFLPIPHDLTAQSKMTHLGYQSAQEELAEKFHMTEDLLTSLNPGTDFTHAGTVITVAAVGDNTLPSKVGLIEVDKAERAVRAYDAKGKLLAFYPATIGSEEHPAPSGALKVANVVQNPTYVFDPKRLTYKQKGVTTRTVVPPGPNNPVGVVWIGLSEPTLGIHGTEEPKEIGKTASHGCIRLTNWDAEELASAAKVGVKVSFLDQSVSGLRKTAAKRDAKAAR